MHLELWLVSDLSLLEWPPFFLLFNSENVIFSFRCCYRGDARLRPVEGPPARRPAGEIRPEGGLLGAAR